MFGALFDEDSEELSEKDGEVYRSIKSKTKSSKVLQGPPVARGDTGLCGLRNQGGTCYLNSLIQTLFLTPEFRERLFRLGSHELGDLCDDNDSSIKARIIPIQLQRLFTQLLVLDQDSISTSDLTESFGWSGNEGLEQHDVQELNRILFSAIESSLVGTSGENLIKELYHGTFVTQVICQECKKISEREEDFLDLQMVLTGCGGLEQSLQMSYVTMEMMEGRNQYRCEACNKLVDATRGAKLRSLPPVLTFSLLRFTYDLKRFERIKETKRYVFPLELDMRAFCEDQREEDIYELYSVVIHRGSCHGGHYHAYIKDVEGLGAWTPPEKHEVKIKQTKEDGQEDVINCSDPVELLSTLLKKLGGEASVDQLCQSMAKETGISWNKRYKKQYGPLSKLFKKHSDVFNFADGKVVSLKFPKNSILLKYEKSSTLREDDVETTKANGFKKDNRHQMSNRSSVMSPWFDFNDSRILCIDERNIHKQFAGRESAYMLFYRKKNLQCQKKTKDTLLQSIPLWLSTEVKAQNAELWRQREEYDVLMNRICVTVHFASDYTVTDTVLVRKQGISADPAVLTMDRRKLVTEFSVDVKECFSGGRIATKYSTIHTARRLPAGLHLYEELTERETSSLQECGVCHGSEVFVWDGRQVGGHTLRPGYQYEPILLSVIYQKRTNGEAIELQKALTKNSTLGELKVIASELTGIKLAKLVLSVMKPTKGSKTRVEELPATQNGNTLEELKLRDGQRLVVDKKVKQKKTDLPSSLAAIEAEKCDNHISFVVESRCAEPISFAEDGSSLWPVFPVKMNKNETVGDLKVKIISSLDLQNVLEGGGLLRSNDGTLGLGPPLYEHETLEEAWLNEGEKLVFEPGSPITENQMALRYYVRAAGYTRLEKEVVVDKSQQVGMFLRTVLENGGLEGPNWHLRKTNWYGEIADMLENEEASLIEEGLRNGDTIVIEEGRLPPKGFIRLSLGFMNEGENTEPKGGGVLSWITSGLQGLLGTSSKHGEDLRREELTAIGEIEISQEATLADLRCQISILPQMSEFFVPLPEFLRIQEIANGYPGRVLRKHDQTLRYLKLTSSSRLSVQLLQEEETLSQSAILLNLKKRVPGTRMYDRRQQVIFDPRECATPSALRQFVCNCLGLNLERVIIAKYVRHKYEWLVITDSPPTRIKKKGGKKKMNLRHAPYHLQDGDVIGVKDSVYIGEDVNDFSTPEDDEGRNRLRLIEEERIRRRREGRTDRSHRPEVELRIHVDDFS